ncbi:uncharacterized protein LOC108224673 [Daucus carota subsp. sativus]|uniref:uncharacterized protein LOC108224673 n=1 Tax=Daucus carota subsp. sativus TaxID=79200 RepID=UPI003082F38E
MADPNSDVPDYDIPITNFDEMLIPEGSLGFEYEGLNDQPIGENIMLNEDMNQFGHDQPIGENIVSNVDRNQLGHDHPIDENRMSDENMNQFGQSTSQAGTSHVNDQFNARIPGMLNPEISGGENPILVAEWPVPEKPYACSCCQVIREIIHTIEGESRKFEIHGRLGMISHGILEICRGNMTDPNKEHHFYEESIDRVRMFLEQYCEKQKGAGYTIVKDPILTFYQAMSVGIDWNLGFDINDLDFLQGSPLHIGDRGQSNVQQPEAQSNEVRPNTRNYKQQRERTKTLTLNDFSPFFHLPQNDAAKEVGVSATIKSLQNKIEVSSRSLNAANPEERARAEADIQNFRREIASFYPPYT